MTFVEFIKQKKLSKVLLSIPLVIFLFLVIISDFHLLPTFLLIFLPSVIVMLGILFLLYTKSNKSASIVMVIVALLATTSMFIPGIEIDTRVKGGQSSSVELPIYAIGTDNDIFNIPDEFKVTSGTIPTLLFFICLIIPLIQFVKYIKPLNIVSLLLYIIAPILVFVIFTDIDSVFSELSTDYARMSVDPYLGMVICICVSIIGIICNSIILSKKEAKAEEVEKTL